MCLIRVGVGRTVERLIESQQVEADVRNMDFLSTLNGIAISQWCVHLMHTSLGAIYWEHTPTVTTRQREENGAKLRPQAGANHSGLVGL